MDDNALGTLLQLAAEIAGLVAQVRGRVPTSLNAWDAWHLETLENAASSFEAEGAAMDPVAIDRLRARLTANLELLSRIALPPESAAKLSVLRARYRDWANPIRNRGIAILPSNPGYSVH